MTKTIVLGILAMLLGVIAIATGYAWSVDRSALLLTLTVGALILGLVFAVLAVTAARAQN